MTDIPAPENSISMEHWGAATTDDYTTLDHITLDLWRISLQQPMQTDVLSQDELTRLNRYRFAVDQRRFAVARSSLRHILANYCQRDPSELMFDYGSHGKPFMSDGASLQFNLSHSGDYALCGVARKNIGVDIEQLRSMARLEGLIKRCLTPVEQASITALLPTEQSSAFLRYWTCKEAYLKATGQGISESLTAIEITLTPRPKVNVSDRKQWQLHLLTPDGGYTGAVVCPPSLSKIRYWNYHRCSSAS